MEEKIQYSKEKNGGGGFFGTNTGIVISLIFVMCFSLGLFLLGFNSSFEGVGLSIQVQHSTIPKTDAITIFENFQPQLHLCDTRVWLRRSAQKAPSSGSSNFLIYNESKISEDSRISNHHIWVLLRLF